LAACTIWSISDVYIPAHFNEDRPEILQGLIRSAGLATIVSMTPDGLIASHAPLMLDPDPAPYGTLIGHLAKANPHARTADPSVQTLVIFQGPDGYITPSYYAAKKAHGKVVPTWNYAAIHAYGPITFFDDPERLRTIVTHLTDLHEATFLTPWKVTDAPAAYIDGQLKAIVGFELPITRLEGKRKFNQNRSTADQSGVITGLRSLNDPAKSQVADFMQSITQQTKPE